MRDRIPLPLVRGFSKRASVRASFNSESNIEREVLFVFAIIETGGKQYKVSEGDIIFVEKLEVEEGSTVTFDTVLAVSGANGFVAGTPYTGNKVTANVVKNGKGKKLRIFRYKAKKNEKKLMGHRQPYTKLQITTIA